MDGNSDNGKSDGRIVMDAKREKECAAFLSGIFDELMEFSIGTGQCRGIFYTEGGCRLSVNQSIEDFSTFARENIHPCAMNSGAGTWIGIIYGSGRS